VAALALRASQLRWATVTARDRRVLWASAALAVGLALLAAVAGHEEVVAYAAPFLGVVLPLLAGRYVGEDQIARIAARVERRRRSHSRPAAQLAVRRRHARVLAPRGTRLLARALAERAPPALLPL
jgi:hypothetical protein